MRLLSSVLSSFCLSPETISSKAGFANNAKLPAWNYGPVSHLKVAQTMWREVLQPGDLAIDATCGNGHDALVIAKLCLMENAGQLHCIDIQPEAIESAKRRSTAAVPLQLEQRVHYHTNSHVPQLFNNQKVCRC